MAITSTYGDGNLLVRTYDKEKRTMPDKTESRSGSFPYPPPKEAGKQAKYVDEPGGKGKYGKKAARKAGQKTALQGL